ncbi:hypothetical protein Ddye_008894 [Dipteronia dyeriana]|uniref:Reverse transcriptase n=1 Tax=Dipteronia dyeriana TaxID=168575 RepID=A0AAE0CLR5_9ROSI|nr:hypothetical protein Ddye_008894 [Dipteronia dyeriana]
MTEFRETTEECNLEDMGSVGLKFTWSNKKDGLANSMETLDRGLSTLNELAYGSEKISGFKCSRGGPTSSHLFFVDDILLFTKANNENYFKVKSILEDYKRASGQVIDFSKSTVSVSPTMPVAEAEKIASLIGMNLIDSHEKFLGLPCFCGRSKQKLFTKIVDCFWGMIKG